MSPQIGVAVIAEQAAPSEWQDSANAFNALVRRPEDIQGAQAGPAGNRNPCDRRSPNVAWQLARSVACALLGRRGGRRVSAVVLVSQTPTGAERLHLALAQTQPEQPQAIAALPPRVVVDEAATKRLADAVRALTADRDRLNARIVSLERNFDDMPGSIKTVLQANAAVQSVKEPAKEPFGEKLRLCHRLRQR